MIYKEIDGKRCEPIEELTINVPEEFSSKMIDMVTRRKGEMTSMQNLGERVDIEFNIPSRGIIGLRTNVLTASQAKPSWLTASRPMSHSRVRFSAAPMVL